MTSFFAGSAIAVYLLAFGYQVSQLRKHPGTPTTAFQLSAALAIVLHGAATYGFLFTSEGLDLSLLKVCALIALVINLCCFSAALRNPSTASIYSSFRYQRCRCSPPQPPPALKLLWL